MCNLTAPEQHKAAIARGCILGLLLIADLLGNIILLIKMVKINRKWTPCIKLIKTLSIVGILNGLVNIQMYLVTSIFGRWVLGEVVCQFHGVIGVVLLTSWVWLLTLAAFERFVKLLVPSEHTSFFSEVNLRIMTWGMFLLLIVMYLGPVYGWGEYSHYRGKLDLILSVNTSSLNTSAVETSNADKPDYNQAVMVYYEFLIGSDRIPTSKETFQNFTSFFFYERNISLRKPIFSPQGVTFPLRSIDKFSADCLWQEFSTGTLQAHLTDIVAKDDVRRMLNVMEMRLVAEIAQDAFVSYRDVFLTFQEASTCSLDYSYVNNNVYSFIIFATLCNLVLPLIFITYFYARLFRAEAANRLCLLSLDGTTSIEDSLWTRIFAYTGYLTLFCHIPYLVVNLCSGAGVFIPGPAHFGANVILYSSTLLLFVFYVFTIKTHRGYTENECCWLLMKKENTHSFMSDVHQRLLARMSSSHSTPNSSPYKSGNGSSAQAGNGSEPCAETEL